MSVYRKRERTVSRSKNITKITKLLRPTETPSWITGFNIQIANHYTNGVIQSDAS